MKNKLYITRVGDKRARNISLEVNSDRGSIHFPFYYPSGSFSEPSVDFPHGKELTSLMLSFPYLQNEDNESSYDSSTVLGKNDYMEL